MKTSKKIDGRKLTATLAVKPDAKAPVATECEWELDFDNVTDDQLLELASRSVIITLQGRFRRAKPVDRDGFKKLTVDVAEELKREPAGVATPEKVKKAFSNLSDADKAALLAELQAVAK